ncbi:hypothetical protein CW749_14570 [Vibrio sp. vnigr-6D03]|uniref:DUF1501 domain-containing protein n=1 Tax=Vibrio sp. vnigr-6D03 TaxID=2058088 RepID=UPI000C32D34D|nr:DUF1501 domain-containing protein [Vibrio sp. vnigr-6D03]PKF78758.1 hypothetical protein CW749_14570 [Vibrio sp. vnigr-6D03]
MSITRRDFLKGSSATALSGMVPLSLTIPTSNALASEHNDYKALVCLFLHGGNDSFNLLIPDGGAHYSDYVTARPDIHVLPEDSLPIPNTEANQAVALNAAMPNLAAMMNEGTATTLVNIGTLIEPTDKTNWSDVKKPSNLGAHNKQQKAWQTSWGDGEYHPYGWAGMMMDILSNDAAIVSDSISFTGNSLLTGSSSNDIQVSSGGVRAMYPISHSNGVNNQFKKLTATTFDSPFQQEYVNRLQGILDFQVEIDTILNTYPADTRIPSSYLGKQLQMVRRMMQAASSLGHSRQVFFVHMGGFDNHSNQRSKHDGLLGAIDQAVGAFHMTLDELNLSDQVVTFSMSDFGRTIQNNSNKGTDHGWGSNQIVVGNAINGGVNYGTFPEFVRDGENAYENKFIPTQSSEQMGATLCRWMGLSEEGVDVIFPSLHPQNTNPFDSRYLGFLGDYRSSSLESELLIKNVNASVTRVNHTPQMAIDGDITTKWTAKGTGIHFLVELSSTSYVTQLLIAQAKGNVRQYFIDVEVSNNGIDFEPLNSTVTPGNTTEFIPISIQRSGVNFIRLTCNGNNDPVNTHLQAWNNIQELKVLGKVN